MSEVKQIRRQKVFIPPEMSIDKVKRKYKMNTQRAKIVKTRGYFIKNYSKRQIIIDRDAFDVDYAYGIARKVFWKNFARKYRFAISIMDDLIQEAVTRQFELSGKTKDNGKYKASYAKYWVAHNAMLTYVKEHMKQIPSFSISMDDLYYPPAANDETPPYSDNSMHTMTTHTPKSVA